MRTVPVDKMFEIFADPRRQRTTTNPYEELPGLRTTYEEAIAALVEEMDDA
jgi:hypothetical protein